MISFAVITCTCPHTRFQDAESEKDTLKYSYRLERVVTEHGNPRLHNLLLPSLFSVSSMNTVGPLDERLTLTPIQRLHPEILAEIFTFCLSTNDVGTNHAPLLLCNVCSSWRALAIMTPLLWTNLNLRFKSLVDSNMQSVVDGIHTWLGRSGILPLTIRLCYFGLEERFDKVLQVCDALSTYASRWKSLDVKVPGIAFASWPNLHAVPLLRTLRIRSHFGGIPFTSAPCLARVHLSAAPITAIPHVPWHQLVELAITEWQTSDDILRLIAWCPLLDSIDVQIARSPPFSDSEPFRIRPVEHAVLKKIKFCFSHDSYTILESLVVPGLKSLSLCDVTVINNRSSQIHSNPLGLLNRSHCDLRELQIVRCCLSLRGLMEYLEHSCRTLTSLRVEYYGYSLRLNVMDELFLRLTRVGGKAEDSLCPELTHLALSYYGSGNTSAGLLGRMILSRSRKTEKNRLESFELVTEASGFAETDKALLKCAEENGLKLCIKSGIRW